MSTVKLIAVEIPFLISFQKTDPVSSCILKDGKLCLYSPYGSVTGVNGYGQYIDMLMHVIKEGRFEWCNVEIAEGQIVSRDYDCNILVGDIVREPFTPITAAGDTRLGNFSNTTLKLFNDFLRVCNKDNTQMVEALKISLNDGYFRKEVESIVEGDEISNLSSLDKEIIVRCGIEGIKYIVGYVKKLLNAEHHEKFVEINYFFRRVFNLERYNYIGF